MLHRAIQEIGGLQLKAPAYLCAICVNAKGFADAAALRDPKLESIGFWMSMPVNYRCIGSQEQRVMLAPLC